jgi:glycosyltransferase involved in cell wall biosynthesis
MLLVSNFFPPRAVGGAEVVAYRQAKALAARGHHVTILAGAASSSENPAGRLSFDIYEGLPVYRLSIRSLDPDLNFYWSGAARRLRAILSTDQIDAVHIHNVMGLGANLIPAAQDAGARVMVTLHDHWGFCLRQTKLRPDGTICRNFEECTQCHCAVQPPEGVAVPTRLRRDYVAWCLSHADKLITPSKYLAGAYIEAGFPADLFEVVSNGIDLDSVSSSAKEKSPDGKVHFLSSAYLGEHKGMFVLLEALKLLAKEPALAGRWHVTIVGDGDLRERMTDILRANRLTENVTMAGRLPRQEVLALFPGSAVTVLASIWPENEPVSMLEAIASGTAQLATRLGGNVELVDDERSGLLVTPGDAVELAVAMRRYIEEPALAVRHGDYNRTRRVDFDERRTIDKIEALLRDLDQRGASARSPEPVIVCGTGWPPVEVAKLVANAHKHLVDPPKPRFVWHEWADSAVWKEANLLWLWDRHPEEGLVNLALRRGVPVLAPASIWTEGLARHYGAVILYKTYLEALAAMRVLLGTPHLREDFSARAKSAATAATALAQKSAFRLNSEVLN